VIQNLNQQNNNYWQNYKSGEIPTVPQNFPEELLKKVNGPILDVGVGDGILAEQLAFKGFDVYGIDIAKNIISENLRRQSRVKYSIQDVTSKTTFLSNFFSLIIFRFTLTNIHKESWKKLSHEVVRILKPSGMVWMLEPLVSESYKKRYGLAVNFVKDKNCVYVFKDKELANKINSKNDLEKAIYENQVSRIVKHYTVEELKNIFNKLRLIDHRTIKVISPSGYVLNTFEGIFLKNTSPRKMF
jgi:ubiquinone/menaquinone biosynthesis C-methylase UbiE